MDLITDVSEVKVKYILHLTDFKAQYNFQFQFKKKMFVIVFQSSPFNTGSAYLSNISHLGLNSRGKSTRRSTNK